MNLQWQISVTPNASGVNPWPARVSVPVPSGTKASEFSITRPDGEQVTAQSRVLTRWPDGTPRWVQLDFQTNQAGEHVVQSGSHRGNEVAPASLPVRGERDGDRFIMSIGRLQLVLDPNAVSPVASVTWNGRKLEGACRFKAVDENGKAFPLAENAARNVIIEADGPHRFQVSWETHHEERLLDVRFRFEVLAGIEGFTLSYQFFHKLPKRDTLKFRSMNAEFPFESLARGHATVVQSFYGNIGLRRFVRANHPVTLHVDRTMYSAHVKNPVKELDDNFHYPPFLRDANRATGSAVALEGEHAAVLFAVREFECQRPKTLTVQPGRVAVGIWPEEAGVLKLPQGRSKRQVFCFRFCEPKPDQVEALLGNPASCLLEPSVCWLDKADSVHAGATWDQQRILTGSEPGAAFFSNLLYTATNRWESIPEMFDYGDTVDTGYTTAYPSQGRMPEGHPQFTFAANSMVAHGHFHTAQQLPPVWSNNEYDAIYCLALEAIRARDLSALRKLCAAARHQIEVDFVHYSDHWQQHRSTPQHSYDHTSLMASIPSHQWTQGLYYYYVLRGDDDAPEIIRAICDFNLEFLERDEISFSLHFNRELGWALIALVFGYEATADERYIAMSKRIIEKLQKDAGRTDFTDMKSKQSGAVGLNATGLGGGFNVNTIPIGVKAYYQATGEEWAKKSLLEWVEYGMTNFNNKATSVKLTELFPETFCYVCELTGETRWLEESLWQLHLFFRGINSIGWFDEHGGPLTTKQYTRIYRGLVHYLSALSAAGMLLAVERDLMQSKK